jgi:hypothetical protein
MPCGQATPETSLVAVSDVAHPQGGRSVAVFYPLGHPHAVRLWFYTFRDLFALALSYSFSISARRGVCKGVEDNSKLPTQRAGQS